MKGKKLISALLFLAVAGASAGAVTVSACKKKPGNNGSGGNVYYIGVDGKSTTEAKGTKKDPWNAWSGLQNDKLQPGDTIRILPGVHDITERITIFKGGEYNKYLNIVADDPTQNTVLSFYKMQFASTNRGVQIYSDFVHWDGVDICGAGDNGMYIGGSYNIVENSRFYDNRDTGLQLGRSYSPKPETNEFMEFNDINYWPSYNLIKNCTSYNNYDNETYGENADGFAAKLTVGYGNVFDGCIAYRNSDDGWDLFAKTDSGNIGEVIMYNCVAFENGFILETQEEYNNKFPAFRTQYKEENTSKYTTRDGDGNGFKLGGSVMEGEVLLNNCLSFNNRMHGITDNSNPGVIIVDGATCYNNGAGVDANGVIAYKGNGVDEGSANVDLARHYYSYNHVANVLSVNDGNSEISNDNYRGTVENCTFAMKKATDAYKVSGQAEYYSKANDRGVKTTAQAATDLFTELPKPDMGLKRDDKGKLFDWHTALRNEDGSVNMGAILALKNAEGTQGSKLNLSKWEDYPHYGMHDLTKCTSKDDAVAQAILDMTYLPIRTEALYQNFDVVTKIKNTEIKWTSSNPSIINITDQAGTSNSQHEDLKVEVIRPVDKDTKVTMTATVKVGDVTKNKDFVINVKRNTYRIGEIQVKDLVGDSIIRDKGDSKFAFTIDKPVVINGTSDSGAVISTADYEYDPYQAFATYDAPDDFEEDAAWDATKPGIWKITVRITLKDTVQLAKKGDGSLNDDGSEELADKVVEKVYYIYVADKGANNSFVASSDTHYVNRYGYVLSGNFVSPTGKLYSVTRPVTDPAPTASQIKEDPKVQVHEFRTTGDEFQFEQANSEAYKIYYFVESIDGTQQSQVYTKEVKTVTIDSKATFENMLANNSKDTLYLQTADIDMTGAINLTSAETPFRGVFNGNGYKISNINIKQTGGKAQFGLFAKVKGGTIMNANFENVVINDNGANEKTGLIGEMEGGYIYNVSIHNIDVNTDFWLTATKYTLADVMTLDNAGYRLDGTKRYDKDGDEINEEGKKPSGEAGKPFKKTDPANGEYGGKTYADGLLVEGEKKLDKDGNVINADGYKLDANGNRLPKRVSIRVGALIGQIFSTGGTGVSTYIQKVSVVNDAVRKDDGTVESYSHVIRGDQRVGGIAGFIQSGSGTGWNNVYIDNCYVDALIESNTYGAGIVGRSDDRNVDSVDSLEITRCYYAGVNYTQKYCGGILGGFTGKGKTRIVSCVSTAKLFYTDEPYEVLSAEKNCSHVVGYYPSNGDARVMNCFANFADHNASYSVTGFGEWNDSSEEYFDYANKKDFWNTHLTTYNSSFTKFKTAWDLENDWTFVETDYGTLKAPYVVMKMG